MPYIVKHRSIQENGLIVRVEVNSPELEVDDATQWDACIDTGGCLSSKKGGYDVGLVLPTSYLDRLPREKVVSTGKKVGYVLADDSRGVTDAYAFELRLIGDDDKLWPLRPLPTDAIFLGRPEKKPVLIGAGVWRRWRIEIDGPANRFSIWTPDDGI